MQTILIIAAGGAIGASLRYLTGIGILKLTGESKVYTGTVTVNIIGCFLAGLIIGWREIFDPVVPEMVLFFTIGVLGSYTTFSTFALESLELFRHSLKKTIIHLFLHVIVAVSSVSIGYGFIWWIYSMAS